MTGNSLKNFIGKAGMIGFLFFLAKGLAWLAVAGVATLFLR